MNRIKTTVLLVVLIIMSCTLFSKPLVPEELFFIHGKVSMGTTNTPVINAPVQILLKTTLPNGNDSWMDLGYVNTDNNGVYRKQINRNLFPHYMYSDVKIILENFNNQVVEKPYTLLSIEANFNIVAEHRVIQTLSRERF